MTPKKHLLLKPFRYIDGSKALLAGIVILTACSIPAFYIQFRHDGFLDFHEAASSSYWYLLDPYINWITFALLTCITGFLFKKRFRVIDIFGMTAVAFFPLILLPLIAYAFGLSGIYQSITDVTLTEVPRVIRPFMLQLVLSAFLMIALYVWFLYLVFQAFQTNLNLRKQQNIIVYILLIVLTESITTLLLRSY